MIRLFFDRILRNGDKKVAQLEDIFIEVLIYQSYVRDNGNVTFMIFHIKLKIYSAYFVIQYFNLNPIKYLYLCIDTFKPLLRL